MAGRPGGHLIAVTGSGARAASDSAPLGLYVHVPFCAAICGYCNFNRSLLDDSLKTRYVAAVVRDIAQAAHALAAERRDLLADTVFFGGGTPSVLAPAEIARILDALRGAFDVAPDAEVTIEANPETVGPGQFDALLAVGVNRLSMGVQSYRDDELRLLDRLHDAAGASRAITEARRAGFDNLSLDLMLALPGQTAARSVESVEALVAAAPEHASLYLLELYPGLPLADQVRRDGLRMPSDDESAEIYEQAMARLDAAGYGQYEISNVARPGYEARHNMKYWLDGEWLGFGPGAHSTCGGTRWKTVMRTDEYVSRIEAGASVAVERRTLTPDDRWREAAMIGLRLSQGIRFVPFARRYGLDLLARHGDHFRDCADAGLLVLEDDRVHLTRRGMLMANDVLAVFF